MKLIKAYFIKNGLGPISTVQERGLSYFDNLQASVDFQLEYKLIYKFDAKKHAMDMCPTLYL